MQDDRPAIYPPRRPRAIERSVLEWFLECGDPHRGFARIRCGGCGDDLLLAFSCNARYFCPSCHQKRVLAYGDWVERPPGLLGNSYRFRVAWGLLTLRKWSHRRPMFATAQPATVNQQILAELCSSP